MGVEVVTGVVQVRGVGKVTYRMQESANRDRSIVLRALVEARYADSGHPIQDQNEWYAVAVHLGAM
uniref:hypothetical protein n=1 Tax=Microbacterium proteolyticum TaxID=1572644 RepID=UPI00241703B4|nr:hypothetical protein [Microbacterium proteolyticum]